MLPQNEIKEALEMGYETLRMLESASLWSSTTTKQRNGATTARGADKSVITMGKDSPNAGKTDPVTIATETKH